MKNAALARSGLIRGGLGRAEAKNILSTITPATPMTDPMRNGSAATFRLGESKIKIVTVMGTELIATATRNREQSAECLPHRV